MPCFRLNIFQTGINKVGLSNLLKLKEKQNENSIKIRTWCDVNLEVVAAFAACSTVRLTKKSILFSEASQAEATGLTFIHT